MHEPQPTTAPGTILVGGRLCISGTGHSRLVALMCMGVVLSGEIDLVLDDSAVHLGPGDVVVQ